MLPVASGYAAKNLCSCTYVMGITEAKALKEDLGFSPITLVQASLLKEEQAAEASFYGLAKRKAIYREGLGCVLLNEVPESTLAGQSFAPKLPKYDSLKDWFSLIDTVQILDNAQKSDLAAAINDAFVESDPEKQKNTRAVVVLYKGQLVGEQYADGITPNTPLLGWSMTKSLTATMIGLLAEEGKIDIDAPAALENWQNTEKAKITVDHLLQMSSGMDFWENYEERSDANIMLWESDSMGKYAQSVPLAFEPGEQWYYSSGTSNILAMLARQYFNSNEEYWNYMNRKVFYPIGAYNVTIEPDGAGNFVGSSFGWAPARDWARIGQLYLNKGQWAGQQILPKSWVDYVQQPVADSDGWYGGHFWQNDGGRYPDLTRDLYSMDGFQGQRVMIIPSEELVIVRLGLTYHEPDFDFNSWVKSILDVLPE